MAIPERGTEGEWEAKVVCHCLSLQSLPWRSSHSSNQPCLAAEIKLYHSTITPLNPAACDHLIIDAGDWTWYHLNAKAVLYHWMMVPHLKYTQDMQKFCLWMTFLQCYPKQNFSTLRPFVLIGLGWSNDGEDHYIHSAFCRNIPGSSQTGDIL